MATAEIEKMLKEVNELVSHFAKMPETKMLIDYDREAEVLYISFKKTAARNRFRDAWKRHNS